MSNKTIAATIIGSVNELGKDGILALATTINTCSCPHCGRVLESVSAMDDGKVVKANPQPGQFIVCYGCAAINVFDEKMQQRAATDEEIGALSHENRQELAAAKRLVKMLIEAREK